MQFVLGPVHLFVNIDVAVCRFLPVVHLVLEAPHFLIVAIDPVVILFRLDLPHSSAVRAKE